MLSRSELCKNGDMLVRVHWYKCDNCGLEMFEGDPRYDADGDLCQECAYLLDKITTAEYKSSCFYLPDNWQVGKHEGVIQWWTHGKAPWERDNEDHRTTPEYKAWRTAVFTRDSFKCQHCVVPNRSIEAHHIKKYIDFPKLRTVVSNGITLCKPCHKLQHKGGYRCAGSNI